MNPASCALQAIVRSCHSRVEVETAQRYSLHPEYQKFPTLSYKRYLSVIEREEQASTTTCTSMPLSKRSRAVCCTHTWASIPHSTTDFTWRATYSTKSTYDL
ncbi:hypothetical protein E2C01_026040 [Portunus trituberculatus]|uniref:Uncharacterized protein n=1 Tax=Portunus trituberculatus TaxID=210409 RepID=A0A5B7EJL5_PORTR|nr:hypothetical protein [Portunus trituberculatus]